MRSWTPPSAQDRGACRSASARKRSRSGSMRAAQKSLRAPKLAETWRSKFCRDLPKLAETCRNLSLAELADTTRRNLATQNLRLASNRQENPCMCPARLEAWCESRRNHCRDSMLQENPCMCPARLGLAGLGPRFGKFPASFNKFSQVSTWVTQ